METVPPKDNSEQKKDQTFLDNQARLHEELKNFIETKSEFMPYHENMQKISDWLNEGKNNENS